MMIRFGALSLFGLQFITVFTQEFSNRLDQLHQLVHLVAMALMAVAAILMAMSPAVNHGEVRQGGTAAPLTAGASLISRVGMALFALSACLDSYLLANTMIHREEMSVGLALAMLVGLWLLRPWRRRTSAARMEREPSTYLTFRCMH